MNYAVVIGIDFYENKPLSAGVRDAVNFSEFLKKKNLVPIENINLLLSDKDTHSTSHEIIDLAIKSVIKDAIRHKTEKNRLYFFFAGHGIADTFENTAMCMKFWPLLPNHCISSSAYKSWFVNKGVFNEILFFLDCCREFDLNIDAKTPNDDWKTQIGDGNSPDILICNSTKYGKLSYEINVTNDEIGVDEKRGAFTTFLLNALEGDADKKNTGLITSYDLKNHVNRNFETFAKQNNKLQKGDAYTQGTNGDNIIICDVEKLTTNHNFEIKFKRNSNVTLKGRDTETGINAANLKTADVKEGEIWQCKLDQGFSVLVDNVTDEKKLIENYSKNTMSYVEF